ncbi:MAG: TerD family protein [Ruminococcus sp.]|nr:TerD family protein [Ruminococcus sp.]HAE51932.1 stress protein [Ruminococcus sp.]
MSLNLQKGQKISLSKERAGLSEVIVGLGWDEAKRGIFKSRSIDCDAFAILLTNGKLAATSDIVYFANKHHYSDSVIHTGDNLTGAGSGDDEQIIIKLNEVPSQYDRIVIGVNIYSAESRKQHFGMIQNAFIRIVDASTNTEMCIYNLTDNYSGQTAMAFGEVYRNNGEWKFNAIGQGTTDKSVESFAARYK